MTFAARSCILVVCLNSSSLFKRSFSSLSSVRPPSWARNSSFSRPSRRLSRRIPTKFNYIDVVPRTPLVKLEEAPCDAATTQVKGRWNQGASPGLRFMLIESSGKATTAMTMRSFRISNAKKFKGGGPPHYVGRKKNLSARSLHFKERSLKFQVKLAVIGTYPGTLIPGEVVGLLSGG